MKFEGTFSVDSGHLVPPENVPETLTIKTFKGDIIEGIVLESKNEQGQIEFILDRKSLTFNGKPFYESPPSQ